MSALRDPENRVRAAWVLLVLAILGCPLSILTFAKDEPRTVLILSWVALALTALNILATADVRREQDQSVVD